MTAAASGKQAQFAPRLNAGVQLGEYVLGQPLWPLRIADAYRANGPKGAATVYVIHAQLSQDPNVRDQIIAGTRIAAALPEHKHLVRTLAAGLTGDILWIATEEVDGSLVRDMLMKKRTAGTAGFGARGTGNLITGVGLALGEIQHGALASESVVVSRNGRVRIADLALGAGTIAAMRAGLVAWTSSTAPELQTGAPIDGPVDVYAVGALLYEALVGSPLERGGPRPSDVVPGTNMQIDEIVARACHKDREKRFGRVEVLGEVVSEALGKGGAMQTVAVPTLDRSLGASLSDTAEKWLISKGRLDYGPFSLAEVVKQINKGDIVAGNIIMDKDTGARSDVGSHPLLGPMVDSARARMDDQRRAQAEVKVQSSEKRRGALLYAIIALGVIGAGVGVYFIINAVRGDEATKKVAGVSKLEGAELKVTVSMPKTPPAKHHSTGGGGGHHTTGGGPGGQNANENLGLDMSDDSDETETLGMDKVYAVYSTHGAQLGGCMQSTGASSANIAIMINGPTGRVNFVKVNGQASGGLYNCISRTMRAMQFPVIHGPRTRAEFDINL